LLLTEAAKNYSGMIVNQEGHRIDPPKHDIKGLEIKKVNTNRFTREYFQGVLKDLILTPQEVDPNAVVAKFIEYESLVRESLAEGATTFALPKKFSGMKAYQNPFQMEVARGTLIWNAVHPELPIRDMEYVNMIHLRFGDEAEFNAFTAAAPDEYASIYDTIRETVFKQEEMANYGFTRLAVPKSAPGIPEWARPMIDVGSMVDTNIRLALILLESIGVVCAKRNSSEKFSTLITF
jgi:hypothetical protein